MLQAAWKVAVSWISRAVSIDARTPGLKYHWLSARDSAHVLTELDSSQRAVSVDALCSLREPERLAPLAAAQRSPRWAKHGSATGWRAMSAHFAKPIARHG